MRKHPSQRSQICLEQTDMSEATCSIDGCDKPIRARSWCATHYSRWREHGDPLALYKRGECPDPAAEAERRRKLSESSRGSKRPRSEEALQRIAAAAAARTPGYAGAHHRVYRARGRAKDQICVSCGKPARHWAWIHDTDPGDPQNYQPMCASCHHAYDEIAAQGMATKGAEGRSATVALAASRRTPEERHAIAMKRSATMRRNAEVAAGVAPGSPLICNKEGCDRPRQTKGLCNGHYQQERRRIRREASA